MSYDLPAIGKPPDAPPLEKIAVEEHFNFLTAAAPTASSANLGTLVRAMDYSSAWMDLVGARLVDFTAERLAGMDASGIRLAILSHTVPAIQGIADAATAVAAARDLNDFLASEIAKRPD